MKIILKIVAICVICAVITMSGCLGTYDSPHMSSGSDYGTGSVVENDRATDIENMYTIYNEVGYYDSTPCYEGICGQITEIRVIDITADKYSNAYSNAHRVNVEVDIKNTGDKAAKIMLKVVDVQNGISGKNSNICYNEEYNPRESLDSGDTTTLYFGIKITEPAHDIMIYTWRLTLLCATDTAIGHASLHGGFIKTCLVRGEAIDHLKLPLTDDMFPMTCSLNTAARAASREHYDPLFTCVLNRDGSVDMDYFYAGGNPKWVSTISEVYRQSFEITYDGGMIQQLSIDQTGNATLFMRRDHEMLYFPGTWDCQRT